MKNLLIAILLLLSNVSYSQIEYPRYEKDSLGQVIVLMTIQQAQALDNSTDLLVLFEKLNGQISSYDSVCVKLVGEKDKIIGEQTIQINQLKESLKNKDEQIIKLKEIINKKDETITNLDKQVKNGEEQISLHKKEVKRLKTKMAVGGVIGGAAIVGLILAIIL